MTTTIGRAALLLLGAALLGLGACAAPSSQGLLEKEDVPKKPEACKGCPDDDELARTTTSPEQLEFVRRVNQLEYKLTGKPLVGGNDVELLLDGPQTHDAQLAAIRKARHHVHLITYIMTDGKLAHDYLEALVERRKRGVIVRLMFDSVGGRTVGKQYRAQLEQAGIEVREYGPMNPVKGKGKEWSLTRRHHRKILVVDGKIAFTGGINISDEYREASRGAAAGADAKTGDPGAGGWRDTHVQIRGPAVAQFQQLFFESWAGGTGGKIERDEAYWPRLQREGDQFVRAVKQQGNDLPEIALRPVEEVTRSDQEKSREQAVYASYMAAIKNARKRIWITQAYFIPNDEFIGALAAAAKRGVDVRVLVPSKSDIKMMVYASRFHYQPILESGARIWEYEGPMLHAKTAVIDSVWSTVGSSNLDYRSFIHNDEANAIIIGADFGRKMERMFQDDLAESREIKRKEWENRSWTERFNQRMAVMLKYWI